MNSDKKICGYCQSPIKNDTEIISCPGCKTPYHKDCWTENEGCAVYGCTEKSSHTVDTSRRVEDMYVNIEFLINERRYSEAITESKRILESDRDSIRAKRYYNKAVSLINTRTKMLEDADNSFEQGDYRLAEIYYTNALQFLDDAEKEVINARIQVVRQKGPLERKRKRITNFVTSAIVIIILGVMVYLGYYYIVLKEDREYAAIEKEDNFDDVRVMEMQLSEYQRFILKYRNGDYYDKASDKVSLISGILADSLADTDWREALKYLKKVNKDRSAKTYNNVYNKIYSAAGVEFNTNVANARKLNSRKKYIEAKKMTEQALDIAREFPDSEIGEQREKLSSNISILSKKVSSLLKYETIQSEIDEKTAELKKMGFSESESTDFNTINATIQEKLSNSVFLARTSGNGTLIALKEGDLGLKIGEFVSVDAKRNGSVEIETADGEVKIIPLYIPIKTDFGSAESFPDRYARESILQRLEYLKDQRSRLDSILNIRLL